jgi:hypothetical protein
MPGATMTAARGTTATASTAVSAELDDGDAGEVGDDRSSQLDTETTAAIAATSHPNPREGVRMGRRSTS